MLRGAIDRTVKTTSWPHTTASLSMFYSILFQFREQSVGAAIKFCKPCWLSCLMVLNYRIVTRLHGSDIKN